jgi:type IV pilus assembly protein PilQ
VACTLPVNTSGSHSPFVDLGSANATSGLGIGYITDNLLLDLQLSAMEKSGNGEIVSQPKVVTADKETAKILKGTEIPYQEASSSGATTTSFKEAALSLEVTPQITPDNRVIMEVKITKDEPDYPNALNGVPPIKKNEVDAKVLVADGETIVIGGVFSNTQNKSVEKVPFLGDLPYLGRLFRRDIVRDTKNELLVFLTPRILNSKAVALNK